MGRRWGTICDTATTWAGAWSMKGGKVSSGAAVTGRVGAGVTTGRLTSRIGWGGAVSAIAGVVALSSTGGNVLRFGCIVCRGAIIGKSVIGKLVITGAAGADVSGSGFSRACRGASIGMTAGDGVGVAIGVEFGAASAVGGAFSNVWGEKV